MTDQLGPDFDERLQAELERFRPPTPLPQSARFSQPPLRYRRLGGLKVALAMVGALAVLTVVAASAASGTDPSTWPQRAVTTVESVTHVGESSPAPAPEKLPQTQAKPPVKTEPSKTAEPEAEPLEPSRGGSPGQRESHEAPSKQSHGHESSPSPNSDGDHSGTTQTQNGANHDAGESKGDD